MRASIQIDGLKCFTHQSVFFDNLTVLAGGNSVGKSTVIQSLLLLRSAYEKWRIDEKQVPLNGEYRLGLGNSIDVLAKGSQNNRINLEYNEDSSGIVVEFALVSAEPQMFLDATKVSCKNPSKVSILRPFFHYLNAERLGPRSLYNIGNRQRNVGWQGEFTVAVLSSTEVNLPEYDVVDDKAFPNNKNKKLRSQVDSWMDFIIPGTRVDPKKLQEINRAYVQYNGAGPFNVGFGISYVLPVVAAGLIARKDEMLIVENPEAHLHPLGQSRIGQFLAIVAATGIRVVVETHSEHVINGIRIAFLENIIYPSKVVFNFFDAAGPNNQPEVRRISLKENADLDYWPKGFFDQQQQDIARIFKLRKQKK